MATLFKTAIPSGKYFFDEVKRLKDKTAIDQVFSRYLCESDSHHFTETDCEPLNAVLRQQ